MIDWKVGDRVIWVDGNEVVGSVGEILDTSDGVLVKWEDMEGSHVYDPHERCLVRWPK